MARPKKLVDDVEVEEELEDVPQVTEFDDEPEVEEEDVTELGYELEYDEPDENLFPSYKTVTTSFRQDRIAFELPQHDRNVAALLKAGDYRVINTHLVIARGGDGTEVYTYWTALARDF